jgi:hypothetical protein
MILRILTERGKKYPAFIDGATHTNGVQELAGY